MRARDNPFSTDRVLRVRYRLDGVGWDTLMTRLVRLNYRAAIVGPKGSGKTTLLEDLTPRLERLGFEPKLLRLDEEHRHLTAVAEREFFRGLGPRDIVLLDGAEQMSGWRWWRFRRRSTGGGGLIITSHRPGLLPTLIESRPTPELLDHVLRELLGSPAPMLQEQGRRLFEECEGNVREVLRGLYDLCAAGECVQHAQAGRL